MGRSYYSFSCPILSTENECKIRNDILMFQQHQGESLSEAWTRFKDLLQEVLHHGIDLWLQVKIFYDHVNPATRRTTDQSVGGPRNFNEATNAWKDKPNFNWARAQTFTSPQTGSLSTYFSSYQTKLEKALSDFDSRQERRLSSLGTQLEQQQDDMISKINNLWKAVFEKLDDTPTPDTAGNFMAHMNLASTDRIEKEKLRNEESEAKEEGSMNPNETECNDHKRIVEAKKEVGDESVEELEEETKEEGEDDPEYFDTFSTMEELGYHEWLLKNPRPSGALVSV
ncbi:hypothetical protein Tco_1031058 [Tanacetum coccineum]|uniref:Zinc finger, CCHC-type n=1 Tax=Tanacetum coccineum TaxID=301880 RepID=A0ABQ5G9T7_9ASTR